jgi:hypothetical protein
MNTNFILGVHINVDLPQARIQTTLHTSFFFRHVWKVLLQRYETVMILIVSLHLTVTSMLHSFPALYQMPLLQLKETHEIVSWVYV